MGTSTTFSCIVLELLILFQPVRSVSIYETDDNTAHGIRFAGNGQYSVMALNSDQQYVTHVAPFTFALTVLHLYTRLEIILFQGGGGG